MPSGKVRAGQAPVTCAAVCIPVSRSEPQSQSELDDSGVSRYPRNRSRARLTDITVWSAEVRMIHNVHEIRPERQLEFLGERELLESAHVPIEITRAKERVGGCIAISIFRRRGKRIGIEPSPE